MAAQMFANLQRTGWLPHQGLIKALMIYKIIKKFLVQLSKVKLLEMGSVFGDIGSTFWSNIHQRTQPTMHFDCPHPRQRNLHDFTSNG